MIMILTKTRKQGNSLTVTIPKAFQIEAGIPLRPQLTSKGIFYEFVDQDDFGDFDEDLLQDLIKQGLTGSELLAAFKKARRQLPAAMDRLIEDAENQAQPMSQEALGQAIGL